MLISLWLVCAFAAQLPYGTGRATSPSTLAQSVPDVLEGSGQDGDGVDSTNDDHDGLGLGFLFPDDDDDYDGDNGSDYYDVDAAFDDYDYDDDDDVDDDYDDDFYDGLHTDFDDVIYDTDYTNNGDEDLVTTTTTCFHCLGDGMTGCNVTDMLEDLDRFTVTCVGKCLNISTGPISVYDCAKDLATKDSMCLDDFDTTMCFCEGSLCNRPANLSVDIDALLLSYPSIKHKIKIENQKGRDDTSNTHNNDASNNLFSSSNRSNVSLFLEHDETKLSTDVRLSNEIPKESGLKTKSVVTNDAIPLGAKHTRGRSSSSPTVRKQSVDSSRQVVSEVEIDIIIPVEKMKSGTDGGNYSSDADSSVNFSSDDAHTLSVASLIDGDSGCSGIVPWSGLVLVLSTCLHFVFVLVSLC